MKARFQHLRFLMGAEYTQVRFSINDALLEARRSGQIGIHHQDAEAGPLGASFPLVKAATICRIEDGPDAHGNVTVLATGYAFCSVRDQFCRRIGRQIAEGRARAALESGRLP